MAAALPQVNDTATAASIMASNPGVNFLGATAEEEHSLPAIDSDDQDSPDESIFADDDDASSALQPAISAAASRLASAHTPAVEKAAAMERLPDGGLFDSYGAGTIPEEDGDSGPERSPTRTSPVLAPVSGLGPERGPGLGHGQTAGRGLGPRKLQKVPQQDEALASSASPSSTVPARQTALEQIFGSPRHKRAQSAGAEALKKLREALPSLPSLPAASSFLPSFPTTLFNNTTGSPATDKKISSPTWAASFPMAPSHKTVGPASSLGPHRQRSVLGGRTGQSQPTLPTRTGANDASPALAKRPVVLRRVTSHDSVLYHSLSRTSSLGDDDRFEHVREMANVRMKAIRDSLPDIKLPSLPKIATPLKRYSSSGLDESTIPEQTATNGGGGATGRSRARSDAEPTTPSSASKDASGASDLDRVLGSLEGDLVIMGGYRGSVLRTAEPPHQQLWAPVKIGLNMRKADLAVGLDPEDEERMETRIVPSGMLKNIGPIDIARKMFKRIRACENVRNGKLRLWDYSYDWRLSPHLLSRRLVAFLETLPSNRAESNGEDDNQDTRGSSPRGAFVVAHSLGGLVTRHAVNQRPDLFAGVVYVGVPQRCVNILGPIRNGDAVLLNEKILTARVNFSMRTTFAFLPEDGFCFVDRQTGEEYRVDFYDVADWEKYRFSPCIAPALPAWGTGPQEQRGNGGGNSLASLLPSLPTLPNLATLSNGLPLRGRKDSSAGEKRPVALNPVQTRGMNVGETADGARRAVEQAKNRALEPQMDSKASLPSPVAPGSTSSATSGQQSSSLSATEKARNTAYLLRTLRDIKQFRAELVHVAAHQEANLYPPVAVIYGKDIPTVYAAKVGSRDAIACADAYDDLVFRSGDGVVLAREAMLPPGYELVKGGRVSTDRGHVTMLGDMGAVGRALEAVVRGRHKGIGLGTPA